MFKYKIILMALILISFQVNSDEVEIYLPYDNNASFIIDIDINQYKRDARIVNNLSKDIIIPDRVSYIEPLSNSIELAVSNIISFLNNNDISFFNENIIIGPYIAYNLLNSDFIHNYPAKYIWLPLNIENEQLLVFELALRKQDTLEGFEEFSLLIFNELLKTDSIIIRWPNTAEIDWYWTIVSYDLINPIIVIDTQYHSFFIEFTENGKIFFIDDFAELEWD